MSVTIVNVSAKLQNGDVGTPTSTAMLLSVGMGRSSNSGRTLDVHDIGASSYTPGFFFENTPASTVTYSFGDYTRSPPTINSSEDFTWSGAMVASGDGDAVRYGLDGTHATNNPTGTSLEFTSTNTPPTISIAPAVGDFISYFIAFNSGTIDTAPSGYLLDVTSEMAGLAQGRWYSKISDGTETSVAATLSNAATGTHVAIVQPAAPTAVGSIAVLMRRILEG